MNEFYQHKKSDSIKWIITFVALILLAVSVVALGAQVFGDGFNFSTSVEEEAPENNTENPSTNPVEPVEPLEPIEATGFSTMKIQNSDLMKLAAKAPTSYAYNNGNYVELEVTVTPTGATTGGIIWSAEWEDSTSSFADGKNVYDYIELEVMSDYSCYVSALQAFGEPIFVTATTVYNSNATASCYVDYGQKWCEDQMLEVGTNVFFSNNVMLSSGTYSVYPIISAPKQEMIDMYHGMDEICFSYALEDVYTKDTEHDEFYYTLCLSDAFYEALCDAGIMVEYTKYHSFGLNAEISVAELLNAFGCGEIVPMGQNDEVDYDLIYAFNEVAKQFQDEYAFTIDVHAISEFDDVNFYFDFYFDCLDMTEIADSIDFNYTQIIL